MGTVEYMAPELFRGAAGTDAGACGRWGITLYELLTGVRPFTGKVGEVMSETSLGEARSRFQCASWGVHLYHRRRRELCSMLSDFLGRHDYQVTAAHDGKTGLAKALGGNYSIMLLDVRLPGLDGFEVLRRLRAAASPMNVLLLTARGEDIDRIVGLEIGADDYLPKPLILVSCWPGYALFCDAVGIPRRRLLLELPDRDGSGTGYSCPGRALWWRAIGPHRY